MNIKSPLNYILKFTFIALPVAYLVLITTTYSVDTLLFEDFILIDEFINICNGQFSWHNLIDLNNEHIILFPKIILLILASFFHYQTKFMLSASILLLSLTYYFFIHSTIQKKFIDYNFIDILYSVCIGFCLFSTVQYENLFWNFQLAWILVEFCLISGTIALNSYLRTQQNKYIIISVIFAVIASFSSLHGLLIWFCYIFLIAIYQFSEHKFDKKIWFYNLTFAAITAYLYTIDYLYNFYDFTHKSTKYLFDAWTKSYLDTIKCALQYLGIIFFDNPTSTFNLINGITIVIIFGFLFIILLKDKKIKSNILPLGCCLYALGFTLVIGIGRANWEFQPRYTSYSLVFLIGILAILRQYTNFNTNKGMLAGFVFYLLFIACSYNQVVNFKNLEKWKTEKLEQKTVILNYKTQKLKKINKFVSPHYKNRKIAIERIGKIEKAKLSIFYK